MSETKIRRDSVSIAHSISFNSIAIFISEIFSKFGSFAITIFLVRHLGKESYGLLVFAFTYVEVFLGLSNFGVNSIVVRELTLLKGKDLARFWRNAFFLRFILTCGALIVALLLATLFYRNDSRTLVCLIWVSFCLLAEIRSIYSSVLTANMKPSWSAGVSLVKVFLYAGFALFFLKIGFGVVGVIQASLAASFVAMLCDRALSKKFIPTGGRIDLRKMKEILSWSWPLAASSLLTLMQLRLDVFMIKVFLSDAEVGSYGIAVRLIEGAFMMSSAVAVAIYPVLSRAFAEDRLFWERLVNTVLNLLLVLSIPFVVIMAPLSQPVIHLFFGSNLRESADILNILCYSVPLGYVNVLLANLLIIGRWQKLEFYASIVTTLTNTLANIVLIPLLKGQGAAVATLLCQIVALLTLGFMLQRKADFHFDYPRIIKLCAIGLICLTINYILQGSVHWMILGLGLFAVFCLISFVTLNAKEKSLVRGIFQKILPGLTATS